MLLSSSLVWVGALVGRAFGRPAAAADQAQAVYDAETGFTFSEFQVAYSLTAKIGVRIAVPTTAVANSAYDAVMQITVPAAVGWAGVAWGGSMVRNPLTVGWANGNTPQISSRWATAHSQPAAYTGATYQKLTAGNKVNGTHWQFTAKCSGCTSWTGSSGAVYQNPKGSNRFALVIANGKPTNPASNTSNLVMHENPIYWSHDFSQGQNANFADLVKKNGGTTDSAR